MGQLRGVPFSFQLGIEVRWQLKCTQFPAVLFHDSADVVNQLDCAVEVETGIANDGR
jgi:hypothetical protein